MYTNKIMIPKETKRRAPVSGTVRIVTHQPWFPRRNEGHERDTTARYGILPKRPDAAPKGWLTSNTARFAERIFLKAKTSGRPIDVRAKTALQPFLNTNVDRIRVHADAETDTMAKAMKADAFTEGSHIFIRPAKYDTGTPKGLALLGHELAHIQQARSSPTWTRHAPSGRGKLEHEAQQKEVEILSSLSVPKRVYLSSPRAETEAPTRRETTVPATDVTDRKNIMTAPANRSLGGLMEAGAGLASSGSALPSGSLDQIVEQVFQELTRRLEIEKERLGVF